MQLHVCPAARGGPKSRMYIGFIVQHIVCVDSYTANINWDARSPRRLLRDPGTYALGTERTRHWSNAATAILPIELLTRASEILNWRFPCK
jgi:hypothetical protein